MNGILKRVPSVDGLVINSDGTLVYYKEQFKNICIARYARKPYRYINIEGKHLYISRLVFEAFVGKFPKKRNLGFKDGNCLNTYYKNLLPDKPIITRGLVKVPGFDDLYVNTNGTLVVQYGYSVNITVQVSDIENNREYYTCCLNSDKGSKYYYVHKLVTKAFHESTELNKVIHLDGNTKNNCYKNLKVCTEKEYKEFVKKILNKARDKMNKNRSIPESDIDKVKKELLKGSTLKKIAEEYSCSDMAVVRFKKKHLSKTQINKINKAKNINTERTPEKIEKAVIRELKEGVPQFKLVKKYKLTTAIVYRINKNYISKAQ